MSPQPACCDCCEFRTVLRPVPLDETALPLFRMLRPLFADERPAKQPRGRVTLPPGCFVASLLAVTIPLERRLLVGGSQRWRNEGTPQAFFQASPKVACLFQAFPKKSLTVLWDFKGLQGFQTSFDAFQIFLLQPPVFGRILDAAEPHSSASLRARPAVRRILRCSSVETRSLRSRDPDRENFQPDR